MSWLLRGPAEGAQVLYLHGQPGSQSEQCLLDDETLDRWGLRVLSLDRPGYGGTDPAGASRVTVVRDALEVADANGFGDFTVCGSSMGGISALAVAAIAPERVRSVVLISGHVLPYDDDEVVRALSPAEQEDVAALRAGGPELESSYAAAAEAIQEDPIGAFQSLVDGWSEVEQQWFAKPRVQAVLREDMVRAFRQGHRGMLDDGLRTVLPLDFDLDAIASPVRALHGTRDDLEPFANLERLAARVPGVEIVALEGCSHFGPWATADLVPETLARD